MRLIVPIAAVALGSATIPASAQQGPAPAAALNLQQETALRCSAAFALGAQLQAQGDERALAWPELGARGREFFVRTSAQIMDETGMSREAVAARLTAEFASLRTDGALAEIMPPCLLMLDASGL